jgi:hypothetical protein
MAAALLCLGISNVATAEKDTESVVTAVFSRSFNKYERPVRPDGADLPLTYVVAKGGAEAGMNGDDSMDDVKFAGIVRILGKYLAKQSYYPAKDGKKADLMLVVHWGKTIPGNDGTSRNALINGVEKFSTMQQQLHLGVGGTSAILGGAPSSDPIAGALAAAARSEMVQGMMEIKFGQDARNDADRHNANLLGYTAELNHRDNPSLYAGAGTAYYDLMEDLETERYYVSVTAYDFQEALQHKNKKGLWRTVASIDARNNRFDEGLMAMVEKASRYFGRDSDRLIRQFDYTPRIKMGELKSLGLVESTPATK